MMTMMSISISSSYSARAEAAHGPCYPTGLTDPGSTTQRELTTAARSFASWPSVWSSSDPSYNKAYVTGEVVLDTDLTGVAPGFGPGATRGNLLLHEMGHLVGLDHVTDPNQIMYPSLSGQAPNGYGAGDRNGLAHVGSGGGCLKAVPPTSVSG